MGRTGMMPLTALIATMLAVDVTFTTVARGSSSGEDVQRQVVVRSDMEWATLRKALATPAPLPVIDFGTSMVVGLFLGTRPSAGFEVQIVAVRTEGETLVVEYVERRPVPGTMAAQMLTEPFHLVSVPRHDGPVRFVTGGNAGR